ncbi:MAG: hypothetical protein U1E22_01980 [Coriobacteriia bacterium]|nr:hypothetical protein [Coriobacteriia bacterium]
MFRCVVSDGSRRPSRSPNQGVDPASHVIGYHVCHRARVTPNNVIQTTYNGVGAGSRVALGREIVASMIHRNRFNVGHL